MQGVVLPSLALRSGLGLQSRHSYDGCACVLRPKASKGDRPHVELGSLPFCPYAWLKNGSR